ncbi:MAG: T9SS type A sorting domain-containing protein, partial [Bacteroidetes bacterium]|nr:T9SS type A sorting domain-containing protein [Bacteroidota bacterium]
IDNMIYQECPQPTDLSYGSGFNSYQNSETTVVIENSGHLRIAVSPLEVTVDYIRSYLPGDGNNGVVAHSYSIGSTTSINSQIIPSNETFQVYPNPFNTNTTIQYTLQKSQDIKIKVFNIMGIEVAELVNGVVNSGTHKIDFNGASLASGQYLCKIETDEFIEMKKMIITK